MSTRNVLIVEDSPTMRQLIGFALRRLPDIALFEAENGTRALEILAIESVHVVLLDLNMPVMNGFRFLEELKGRPSAPPIIVITTESAQEDIDRAIALGAVAYVTKPVRGPDLADTVRQVLGG